MKWKRTLIGQKETHSYFRKALNLFQLKGLMKQHFQLTVLAIRYKNYFAKKEMPIILVQKLNISLYLYRSRAFLYREIDILKMAATIQFRPLKDPPHSHCGIKLQNSILIQDPSPPFIVTLWTIVLLNITGTRRMSDFVLQ